MSRIHSIAGGALMMIATSTFLITPSFAVKSQDWMDDWGPSSGRKTARYFDKNVPSVMVIQHQEEIDVMGHRKTARPRSLKEIVKETVWDAVKYAGRAARWTLYRLGEGVWEVTKAAFTGIAAAGTQKILGIGAKLGGTIGGFYAVAQMM